MADPSTPAPPARRGGDPPPPLQGGFWTFLGALLIARREKDEKVQRAARNVRWFFTTGFAALIAWRLVTWATDFMDRQQASAEARDAALVTTLAEVTEQLEALTVRTRDLSSEIVAMRSLAIGSGKLPDCPACVCVERRSPPPPPPSKPRDMRPGKEP